MRIEESRDDSSPRKKRQFSNSNIAPEEIIMIDSDSDEEDVADIIDLHMGDPRRVFIEQPRVRLDGVYIAVCHYMYAHPGHSIAFTSSSISCIAADRV